MFHQSAKTEMSGRRDLFGVLNLNKPAGVTSRDVVNVVQRLVRPAKTGHAGTLDPMATGVLLVCVGPATRLISLLQQQTKTYVADFRLGQRSDTDDSTGTVEDSRLPDSLPSADQVRAALSSFVGTIEQTPPAYSAVHVAGRRAYELARAGQDVELAARKVRVDAIEVLNYDWPSLSVQITCGSGTYIRSIARDLGELLNCGGLMSALQRTAIGSFPVSDAVRPDLLTVDNLATHLTPAVRIVDGISKYVCTVDECERIARGHMLEVSKSQLTKVPTSPAQIIAGGDEAPLPQVALLSPCGEHLLAVGEIRRQGRKIQPRTVFAPPQ